MIFILPKKKAALICIPRWVIHGRGTGSLN